MVYNLTEKLKFDDDPKLIIRNVELTIRSDAETVLKLMDIVQTKGEIAGAREAFATMLSAADLKKLNGLKLKMNDYTAVMSAALSLALGEDPDEEDSGE